MRSGFTRRHRGHDRYASGRDDDVEAPEVLVGLGHSRLKSDQVTDIGGPTTRNGGVAECPGLRLRGVLSPIDHLERYFDFARSSLQW